MSHLVTKTELYYDPDYANTIIEEDAGFLESYLLMPDEEDVEELASYSGWLLRMTVDKTALIDKNIKLTEIKDIIKAHIPKT